MKRRRLAIPAGVLGLALITTGAVAGPVAAAEPDDGQTWTLDSPSGEVRATIWFAGDGTLALAGSDGGTELVRAEQLGLFADGEELDSFTIAGATERQVVEQYTMTTGKRLDREATYDELTLDLRAAGDAELRIVVRAGDDGIAYRYVLPENVPHRVTGEAGVWSLAADGAAYLQSSYAVNYESDWTVATTSSGNGRAEVGYPALFDVGGSYVLLTESDNTGQYSGTHLRHEPGSLDYGVGLFEDRAVEVDGPLATPWRVAVLGDLAGIVESTIVDDLATPSRIEDTSWVDPGISAWSWITAGTPAQSDLALQKRFVDLAAENGWEYSLIDEGWRTEWVPELVQYAADRDVRIIAWFHSDTLQSQSQRDEWFPRLAEWGVAGVKVDFMDTDRQEIFQWYADTAAEAAEHRLMVNFHGATLPRGLQRTYPNVMTYEAVRGRENGMNSARSLIIPFTRGVVGSMDFTPVLFSQRGTASSAAQELAQAVVYESGWQHLADSPDGFANEPDGAEFLQNIPAVWDETRLISGEPAESIVLARRNDDRWYFGGMQNGEAASLDLPLDVLGEGEWIVDLVSDGGSAVAPSQDTLAISSSIRTHADTLTIPTAANGGFAAIACQATDGRTTCYESVDGLAKTSVTVEPPSSFLEEGSEVAVSATFEVRNGEVSDVTLDLPAVDGFAVEGEPVIAEGVLGNGRTVTGRWTIRADGADIGSTALPVTATFTTAGEAASVTRAIDVTVVPEAPEADAYVSDLPWILDEVGFGSNQRDAANPGSPLILGGVRYAKGVGAHAVSKVGVWLGGQCTRFTSTVGLSLTGERPHEGSVRFRVIADGAELAATEVMREATAPATFDVDVTGAEMLTLLVDDAGDGKNNDHANWVDALLECDAPVVPDSERPTATLAAPDMSGPFPVLDVQVDATDDVGLRRIVANIYRNGALVKSTQTAVPDGVKSATHAATVQLPDGDYTVKYNSQDLSGNISRTGTFAFTIDATKPTVTVKEGAPFTVATGTSYDLVSYKLHDAGKIDRVVINGVVKDLTDDAWSDVNFLMPGVFGAVKGENTMVVHDVAGNSKTVAFTLN
ncbi:glycoside hydrolase family 97 catalytic domain-containing protein [Agromyces laixinhei]|uniref:glycoside hydrolase family 97 catalytic domain-containing protein n=1 Tax=Agromyces laixinhei TaxID=2585717 RepID=UPI0012EE8BC6|nr:glycoside hydrolase family 97 catalytic domain-containing protein [Agromyces laixinhei]